MNTSTRPAHDARERILTAAYDLFVQRGIRAVGINEIIATANVAKATFYAHFPSKDDLIVAFLDRRREVFTVGYMGAEIQRRASTPRDRLLVMFDVLDEWFHHPDYAGCPYIRALLDTDAESAIGQATIGHLEDIQESIEAVAHEMKLTDPQEFAKSWVLILQGSVISSMAIDDQAASRARKLGQHLLAAHSPQPSEATTTGNTANTPEQTIGLPAVTTSPAESVPATGSVTASGTQPVGNSDRNYLQNPFMH